MNSQLNFDPDCLLAMSLILYIFPGENLLSLLFSEKIANHPKQRCLWYTNKQRNREKTKRGAYNLLFIQRYAYTLMKYEQIFDMENIYQQGHQL